MLKIPRPAKSCMIIKFSRFASTSWYINIIFLLRKSSLYFLQWNWSLQFNNQQVFFDKEKTKTGRRYNLSSNRGLSAITSAAVGLRSNMTLGLQNMTNLTKIWPKIWGEYLVVVANNDRSIELITTTHVEKPIVHHLARFLGQHGREVHKPKKNPKID